MLPGESDLGSQIGSFFRSLNDIAAAPSDLAPRAVAIERGNSLAEAFNSTAVQLEQLKKAMEQGQKPGGKKGEKPGEGMPGGQGGMSKQLAQMAAKQAAIRKAIQQMQEELEKGNGGGGSLEKLQEMMEQL